MKKPILSDSEEELLEEISSIDCEKTKNIIMGYITDLHKERNSINNKLMLIKSDLDRAITNKNWFDVKLAWGRL